MKRVVSAALAAALLVVAGATAASAACPVTSACSATPFLGNPACCGPTSCTIDGSVTTSGAACTFDFDGRTVLLTGQLNVGSNTATISAGSMRVSGAINAVGSSGNAGGNVSITTTGGAGVAFTLQPGTGTGIDVSGFGNGGTLSVLADGAIQLTAGSVRSNGLDNDSSGGMVSFESTAGDIIIAVPITTNSGLFGFGGSVDVLGTANVTVTDAGQLAALGGFGGAGLIGLEGAGAVQLQTGGRLQVNGIGGTAGIGGEIDVTGGSVEILGALEGKGGGDVTGEAGGDGGIIGVEARTAGVTLTRSTVALIVDGAAGGFGGEVNLLTSAPALGAIAVNGPISAQGTGSTTGRPAGGGAVTVDAAATLDVPKTINVNGAGSGAGSVDLSAGGDVSITGNISGIDVAQGGFLTVAGHDVTTNTSLFMRSASNVNGNGGEIDVTADLDVAIQGGLFDASGSGTGEGGPISISAGRNVTVAQSALLDASSGGTAADSARSRGVSILAGSPDLAGNLTIAGDVNAISRSSLPLGGDAIVLGGCDVRIESLSVIDSTGNAPSNNRVIGRKSITVNGRIRATHLNVAEHPTGMPPTVAGGAQVSPAFTPVARPLCTAPGVPADCMVPCHVCGNGIVEFPEQCEPGPNGCVSNCDQLCRTRVCTDVNPCTVDGCDPTLGCLFQPQSNGTLCDDATVCNGRETCQTAGDMVVCEPSSPPDCDDGNPCTVEACDADTGCTHTPLNNTWAPGCDDHCVQRCTAGVCTTLTPPDCNDNDPTTTDSCNPANGTCSHVAGATCTSDAQCNDNNPCTTDSCRVAAPRICQNIEVPDGTGCADSNVCDGSESCQNGICKPGVPMNCDDADPCTADTCDAASGCQHPPIPNCCTSVADCNDGNPCTTDACTNNQCSNLINAGCCAIDADCDDGEPCTTDHCVASSCQHTPAADGTSPADCLARCGTCGGGVCQSVPCPDDTDPCTEAVCDPVAGCTEHPLEGCCTSDANCDDASPCTVDACNTDLHACTHTPVFSGCRLCTGNDDCDPLGPCGQSVCGNGGFCLGNIPPTCDDGNAQTLDRCVLDALGAAGCAHMCLTNAVCDDGDVCNGTEQCNAGMCVAGPLPSGYPRARCALAAITAALAAAAPGDVAAPQQAKIAAIVTATQAKLTAAETAGTGKPAKRALAAARKQLKKLTKVVKAGMRKHKIAGPVAEAILAAAGDAGQAVDALKAQLSA